MSAATTPAAPASRSHWEDWTSRARHEVRSWCGRSAPLFTSVYGMREGTRRNLVRAETDLCIEGFPRSANSYAVVRFAIAQPRRPAIAHHLHVPAQITRAAAWKIPTLLLIRRPIDAAASMLIRHPELLPQQVLRAYTAFYQAVLPYRDAFVLGTFEEATSDLGKLVQSVNDRFGTTFVPPVLDPDLDELAFRRIERANQSQGRVHGEHAVSRPSTQRAAQKEAILRRLTTGRGAVALRKAEAIWQQHLETRCS